MFAVVLRDLLLFLAALAGLALPILPWLGWTQSVERLTLAIGAALIVGYLAVFGLYLAELPLRWFWVLPAAGLLYTLARPAAAFTLWRDAAIRHLLGHWLLLALWCLGWQGLVATYSGGGWSGDWVEHYDRAHFFLQRWPTDFLFIDLYPLPARPPLENLWEAAMLAMSGGAFAHHQVFSTLLASMVLFPLTVLLVLWRAGRTAPNLLLCLLMLSPMFVQNATFPWTKLPAAFFVLVAITQLSPAAGVPRTAGMMTGFLALAGAMLVHYSAGPWIFGLGGAFAWTHRRQLAEREFQRSVLLAGLAAGLLLATWLGWALAVYGPATTFLGNSTFALSTVGSLSEWAGNALTNLWSTLAPFPSRAHEPMLQQSGWLGQVRDYWFSLFELKLPFAFGSAGMVVLLWHSRRLRWTSETAYWLIALPVIIVLGTATHTMADGYGLAHIALQPLVLLGLAWLAARADLVPRWLTLVWLGGLVLDFCLGILLQFAVQSLWIERWLQPDSGIPQILLGYNWAARANYYSKIRLHLTFLADLLSPFACLVLLAGAGLTAGLFYRRAAAFSGPPHPAATSTAPGRRPED